MQSVRCNAVGGGGGGGSSNVSKTKQHKTRKDPYFICNYYSFITDIFFLQRFINQNLFIHFISFGFSLMGKVITFPKVFVVESFSFFLISLFTFPFSFIHFFLFSVSNFIHLFRQRIWWFGCTKCTFSTRSTGNIMSINKIY